MPQPRRHSSNASNAAAAAVLWCLMMNSNNMSGYFCEAWSLRKWARRTTWPPVRTMMFKIATITTAISIGPMNHVMNASADVNTAPRQPQQTTTSFFRDFDPFRVLLSGGAETSTMSDHTGSSMAGVAGSLKKPSRTAVIITGTGAAIVLSVKVKADDLAAKKRRQELAAYLTNKKPPNRTTPAAEPAANRSTASQRSTKSNIVETVVGGYNMRIKNGISDASRTMVLSMDKNAFRTADVRVSDKPMVPSPPAQQRTMTIPTPTTTQTQQATKTPIVDSESTTAQQLTTNINYMPSEETKAPPSTFTSRPDRPDIAAKYAAIESLEERAFQILLDLGMIEVTTGPSTI
jgi:hypothetical protein